MLIFGLQIHNTCQKVCAVVCCTRFTSGTEVVSVGFWDYFQFFSWPAGCFSLILGFFRFFSQLLGFLQFFQLDFGMCTLEYPKMVAAYTLLLVGFSNELVSNFSVGQY